MKKLLTLLAALTGFMALQAQTTRDESRGVILGSPKNGGNTGTNGRDVILGGNGNNTGTYPNNNYPYDSRDAQISQVNRDIDARIYSIRNNPRMSNEEKDRAIRQLEIERARRIRAINNANNGDYKHYKKDKKHDNGKHLGWEKGKGNPHRNGGKNWKDDD